MGKMLDVIADDFAGVGRALADIAEGAGRGVYTPFCLGTGSRRINEDIERSIVDEAFSVDRAYTRLIPQLLVAGLGVGIGIQIATEGKGSEVAGVLIATNTIDYLVNAYRRSR